MRIAALLPLVFLIGCAGSFDDARDASHIRMKLGAPAPLSERCQSLDATHRAWGATAKGAGFLAGASGLAAIPDYSKEERIALAAGAVAAGAVAVTAVFVSEDAATSFVKECTQ